MRKHVVRQGECMTTIARRFGVTDAAALWNDPANAELRKKRPDLNVLAPGDEVVLPDVKPKSVGCNAGVVNDFQATLPRKKLSLFARTPDGKPIGGAEYRLVVGERELTGKTRSDGGIEELVDALAGEAKLSINGGPLQNLGLAHLNPMQDTKDAGITGAQARLRNLGYDVPVDGVLGAATVEAIQSFAERHGLESTGELSEAIVKKLEQEHGC